MAVDRLRKAIETAVAMRHVPLQPPLDERGIEITSRSLQEYRLPPLPDDYRALLSITNGFVGLNYILRASEPFAHEPPLLAGTILAILRDEIIDRGSIVVGRLTSDSVLTYHGDKHRYLAVADCGSYADWPDLVSFIEERNHLAAERLARLSPASASAIN